MKVITKERSAIIGCAMIWIVLYHARIDIPFKLYNFITSIGYGGVDICIFSSGIGCYYSLSKSADIVEFIKRRFARLLPTYWSFLPFWIFYKMLNSEITVRGAFCNFLGLEYITNKGEAFNWYITAILFLYLLAPYVKHLVDRSGEKKKFLIVVGSILVSLAFWESKTYIIIFTRIPLFILGMIFAQKSKEEKELSKKELAFASCASVVGVLVLKICMDRYSDYLWTYGLYWYPFILITPGLFIWLSICLRWIDKDEGLRWIKRALEVIGNHSFEVYLVHIPLFECAHRTIEQYELMEYRNYILIGTVLLAILGCIILKTIVNSVLKVNKKSRNFIILFLCMFIGVSFLDIEVKATEMEESPLAVLYSASDFQNSEGHAQGAKELERITKQIYNSGNKEVSEALICGDYYASDDISKDESGKGINYIYEVLNSQWGLEHDQIYFVQGNHDPLSTLGLDSTGGTDREHYSVYQINHDDYMWTMSAGVDIETKISETAEDLRGWLNEKSKEGYSKPIFIITHLPLHHSYRYDNPYSEYLFDVLNEAGERGLNIVYLFGHNHSKEYDNYLGGSSIYLSKGDEIIIPDIQGNNVRDYETAVLNFTYMNAGYIGKTSDGVLSSCIFEIFEDKIEIKRYTKEGECDLKASGVSSENDFGWNANTIVKQSPQIVDLNQGIVSWDETIVSEKVLTDINKSLDLKVNVQNLENYDVVWECRDTDIAEISVDRSDMSKASIIGKKYGTAQIVVTIQDFLQQQACAKLELQLLVAPQNAICLSYGEKIRFYGLVDDMSTELIMSEDIENDYIISNSDQTGIIKAFAAQADEYLGTEELQMIYVPGVGNVLTENREKNVLWRFAKIEEMLNIPEEYQLQISPKSLLRDRYYLAATSGIDSGLGYPNLANMRTCSKNTSAGAVVFRFDNESAWSNYLMTTHHYKDRFKENEYGTFYFTYDDLNDQFVLSNQPEKAHVYFYGRISEEISDVLMWTDADAGKAHVGDAVTEQTGGVIYVMHEGNIEKIPITLEMLSGFEENVSGKHICTLSFNGEVLSENYELNLKNDWFMLLKSWIIELFN